MFWRGYLAAASSLFCWLSQGRAGLHCLLLKRSGWLVACLFTLTLVTFIPALQLTNVSNVAVIITAQPLAAATMAGIWLG